MVFDLTSSQQASHDFIHPELTNCSVSIKLKFSAALASKVENFLIREKASTIYIDSARKVSKNRILPANGRRQFEFSDSEMFGTKIQISWSLCG